MKVKIKDKTVELKYNFRAEMYYEEIEGHTFNPKNTSDWLVYYFCTIVACTSNTFITFNEYIEWLNDNAESLFDFIEFYTEFQKRLLANRAKKHEKKDDKKKKVKAKPEGLTAGSSTISGQSASSTS